MSRPAFSALALLCSIGLNAVQAQTPAAQRAPARVDVDSLFHSLDARPIGPPGTSGRVAAVAVSPRDEREVWVGAATGGLWKSTDGAFTWRPVMDTIPVNSIGAIGIAPSAPDVVYVGTGEANTRNSMGVGRGVYRTQDGGRSWTYLGLAGTERIEAVLVHPRDPNTVWLSAQGAAWSDSDERGVFKSTDGGRTWRKVLYVDARTGAFDLVLDPSNPQHLIASTWEHRRWPWFFTSGGEGSGIWTSWDGGETWRRLGEKDGLPKGNLGRIGLAIATNEPRVAYALVEAEKSALLRSDDGGETWRAVNTETNVNDRPFYYSRIDVDPTNENRVYRIAGDLTMSEDGGRTFRNIAPWSSVHVDHHAFWAAPDGHTIITGNDGGVYVSHDRGGAWRFIENLVLAQFYHISVDNAVPFNVLGGLQDNGSWRGPSQVWETPSFKGSFINAHHWQEIGFGDGFAAIADPRNANLGYSMSQGGNLRRFNLATGEERDIMPPAPAGTKLRFNWNAGIALDPHDPDVLYYGSQFVHVSRDRGESWSTISPDLTTNDREKQKQANSGGLTLDVTAAENHTTILTIAPSPVERGVIWVGTDDGNVQVTRDGGGSWSNVVSRIRGVPAGTWVPHVEASKHAAGTAYVVFDDHRRGDWTPYVYRTRDFGASWQRLAVGVDGYAHAIEEDPVEPNLLFLGTEFGLYVSLDAGESWRRWTPGPYPASASTMALVVHPRDHDLAIGTHGRGAWIVDDIRPLRALARDRRLAERDLHVFEVPAAIQHERGISGPFYFPGDTKYQGPNRPYGALISYWVGAAAAKPHANEPGSASLGPQAGGFGAQPASGGKGPARIEILEADSVIRRLSGPARYGVNRIAWALERGGRPQPGDSANAPEPRGAPVLPGRYRVRVTLDGDTAEASLEVLPDPRGSRELVAMRNNLAVITRGQNTVAALRRAIDRLERTQSALELYGRELRRWEGADSLTRVDLRARVDSVAAGATRLLNRLRLPPDTKGIVEDTTMMSRVQEAVGRATSTPDQPAQQRVEVLDRTGGEADALLAEIDRFYASDVAGLREALRAAGFELLGGG